MDGQNINIGQCLAQDTLTDYLGDDLEPVVRAACEMHLIGCDKCRESLALFMRVLRIDIDPQEEAALKVISARWAERKLDPGPQRKTRIARLGGWILPAAAAAVLVVGLVSGWLLRGPSAQQINELILAQTRPFVARLTAQSPIPIEEVRGTAESPFDFGLLALEMESRSAGKYEMGVFHLIHKEIDTAIQYLEDAAADSDASADVYNDLGVAYLQQSGDASLQKAGTEFRRALQKDPGFAAAVFNQSVLFERLGERAQAEQWWQRYLQLDPTSKWADEVRAKQEANRKLYD